MMGHDGVEYWTIDAGDAVSVKRSPDGEWGVRVRQQAFVEPDRWLVFGTGGDDLRRLRETIFALQELEAKTRSGAS